MQGFEVLTSEQKEKALEIMLKQEKVFSDKPGRTNKYEHRIIPKGDIKVRKTYDVPLWQMSAVDIEIQRMLDMGIIEPGYGPHFNPIRIVPKKNGEVRVCLDARFLNSQIESDGESPPKMEELLQRFFGAIYFSSTDLVCGYWQIPLSEESRPYTAFLYRSRLYQFTRVPYGLKTAGADFIRALRKTLEHLLLNMANYVDDISFGTPTFEEHLALLDKLFEKLIEGGFTLSLQKSHFFCQSISFLGVIIDKEGIRTDPEKLQVIQEFPSPKNKKQLQGFLGVCGFYRRFCFKYVDFIAPFRELLGNKEWKWEGKHEVAFMELKKNFLETVPLSHYDPDAVFRVYTDASASGLCAVLCQGDCMGDLRIISIVSRVLSKAEFNYGVTERELLAIVYGLVKFRTYLCGVQFEIVTDHQALTFLLKTPYHNSRLMRWTLFLQEYDFEIGHCPGKDNIVADFFSRKYENDDQGEKFVINNLILAIKDEEKMKCIRCMGRIINSIEISQGIISDIDEIRRLQSEDKIITETKKKDVKNEYGIMKNDVYFKINQNGDLRSFIPQCLVLTTLRASHEASGHAGSYKLYNFVSKYFYWRYIKRDIKRFTKSCDLCQRVKYLNCKMEGAYQFIQAKEKNQVIAVDFYGPLPTSVGGVQFIFVIQDLFSKLVTLFPIKRATTQICLKKLSELYFPTIGKPARVLTDHGTQFSSPVWKDTLASWDVKAIFSSIRHPQSNPAERTMRELGRLFRTYSSHAHEGWAKHVKKISDCLNLLVHKSTGFTPYFLHYGKDPEQEIYNLFPCLRDKNKSRKVYVEIANKNLLRSFHERVRAQGKVSKVRLALGDFVLLRVPHLSNKSQKCIYKFFHIYEGPYYIKQIKGENAFLLADIDTNREKGTYNRLNLKPYHLPDEDLQITEELK